MHVGGADLSRMTQNDRADAEARTDRAFSAGVYEDPRATYRNRLRFLKDSNPRAFETALAWYEDTLVPAINRGDDPIAAWIAYGRQLGELTAPGVTHAIDAGGRAREAAGGANGELILHLPDDTAAPALALAVPRQLSPAQRACLDLLIERARGLAD